MSRTDFPLTLRCTIRVDRSGLALIHGCVLSGNQWVAVRLDPLQEFLRRSVQERLCRKPSVLGAKIPGGKWLCIEVGDAPF